MDSLIINPIYFYGDPIIYHKSEMEQLSKGIYIWNSEVNEYLVQLQKYCEEFIFLPKHHTQSTEYRVQEIATFPSTVRSEEDDSTLVSLRLLKNQP